MSSASDDAHGELLAPVQRLLERHGFTRASEHGVSSGGPFSSATFRRNSVELGFIVRGAALGCPNYSIGHGYVGHENVLWALGRAGDKRLVRGAGLEYRDRLGGDAIDALCNDLEHLVLPALEASAQQFALAVERAREHLQQQRGW